MTNGNYGNFGDQKGVIWLDDVRCTGNEQDLWSCNHTRRDNCGHTEDVELSCRLTPTTTTPSPPPTTTGMIKVQPFFCQEKNASRVFIKKYMDEVIFKGNKKQGLNI